MNNNVRLAVAMVLLWLAGLSFFAAFHPGGIYVNGKPAANPVDVIRYLMWKAGQKGDGGSPDIPAEVAT